MNQLSHAISMAAWAHEGQLDRDNIDYIFHPLRVMESVRKAGFTGDYLIVAVLHDVVEDTHIELSDIRNKFGDVVCEAVDAVTRRTIKPIGISGAFDTLTGIKKEPYFDFVERAKQNPIGRIVKTHDVLDNLGRNPQPSEHKKYTKAYAILNDLPQGQD